MSNGISYEDYLNIHGSLTYSSVGVSMLPLLRQGKDLFVVRKKGPERCHVGDVILYRRPPEHYVLHRIIQVRENDYVILGDNCIAKEYGIRDEDIIGVMTGFIRDGKEHSTEEAGYRVYSCLWLFTAPMRVCLKKALVRLRRMKH
jgi:hypothetical protein